jgi:hypothetical protein
MGIEKFNDEMGEKTNGRVIIAIQLRMTEVGRWIRNVFLTKPVEQVEQFPVFLGFATTDPKMQKDFPQGSLLYLNIPQPINNTQRVWLTPDGDVFIARDEDPINDPEKHLLVEKVNYPPSLIAKRL